MIDVILPLKIVSSANVSEHWTARAKRNKKQQQVTRLLLSPYRGKVPKPCEVILTRYGKKLLDDDNLAYAFKAIRDATADIINPGLSPGMADNDTQIQWHYKQNLGPYKATIQINGIRNDLDL